jgi:Asp-tRNA(Asn)/Glu-tRNA(Gln) amidotransferase A subunit family amidase
MAPFAFAPASRLAALVRQHDVGCLELLDYFIARVEQLDGKLNAVVVRDFDRARARALENTAPTGPLHGVPMTAKEAFDGAGLPTTWGFPQFTGNIAKADSLTVARLKAAGAVVFGKSNVPKGLADWQSYNEVYGATANPWNLAYSPGGSSGGAAAALAAGLTGMEMGSDSGGFQGDEEVAQMQAQAATLPPEDMSTKAVTLRAAGMSHRSWLALNEQRFRLRRVCSAFFNDFDVLLCPAFGRAALPRMEDGVRWDRQVQVGECQVAHDELLFWSGVTCGFHLPSSVAPVARGRDGLPIGVQVVARPYGDRTTIAVAGLIEALQGGFGAPPSWT